MKPVCMLAQKLIYVGIKFSMDGFVGILLLQVSVFIFGVFGFLLT